MSPEDDDAAESAPGADESARSSSEAAAADSHSQQGSADSGSESADGGGKDRSDEESRSPGLSAFVAASEAAARAEAERDESSSLWGDDEPDEDDPQYAEVRRSAPGWQMAKWIISAVVATAVVVISFIMIPRLFTPNEAHDESAGGASPSTVVPTTAPPAITYPDTVLGSGAAHYWKFEMQAAGADATGGAGLNIGAEATVLGSSAYAGGIGALDCSGTAKSRAESDVAQTPVGDFSIEVWINSVSSAGGPIVTFGNKVGATSSKVDRVMYMGTNGKIYFGTLAKSRQFTVSELPVNTGAWRHVVGTMSTSAGLTLYVDGAQTATEQKGTATSDFEGYWKVCGDNTSGWPGNSGRPAFTGTVDDVAIYPKALSAKEVLDHYEAAKGL